MEKRNLMKYAAAVALLFAVNMNADAQFGSLKGLANKAKTALKNKAEDAVNGTTTTTDRKSVV